MRRVVQRIMLVAVCLGAVPAMADEGMWLFNAVPKARIKEKYGFEPSQAWLDHLRLSSVRMGDSGAFVSPDGLILTNHHVGRSCIIGASTKDQDLMRTGFYAKSRQDEIKCPGLEVEVLEEIEDITENVTHEGSARANSAEAENARNAAVQKIQLQCSKAGSECEVVPLYAGALYHLYKYKKFSDVRLVFAPEFDIAFFGGDADNYRFPRYDLDVAFFRVYELNMPVHPEHYLAFSAKGAQAGDLVFASGNPSSTARFSTYAQLEFLRDFVYPAQINANRRRARLLQDFSEKSADNARMVAPMLWDLENRTRAVEGYLAGLLDPQEMARKLAEEKKVRAVIANDPRSKALYGDPWAEIEKSIGVEKKLRAIKHYPESVGLTGRLADFARMLVRASVERQKPNRDRIPLFRAAAWQMQERSLLSSSPVDKALEEITLTDSLSQLRDDFGERDPLVQKVLAGKTAADRAHELVYQTVLNDVEVRRRLLAGGQKAIDQSRDPLIALLRCVDAESRLAAKRTAGRRSDYELTGIHVAVGMATFAATAMTTAPDATGNLRLSLGVVSNATDRTVFTRMGQAFSYADANESKPSYELPESWRRSAERINRDTPLNFVSTVDVIGGNSGSPLVNVDGELIGVVFDANQAMLAGRHLYQDKEARAIVVDVRAIVEALRNIYAAGALVDEITGQKARLQ